MGYGLMAYAVDAKKMLAVCGSGNTAALEQITGWSVANFADREEERAAELLELGGMFDPDSFETAWGIRDLVLGQERTLTGAEYGYAYKALVAYFGKSLDNRFFYPADSDYMTDEIDPQLKATGATVRLIRLLYGGALVAFPSPDDFPTIGYWSPDDIAASVAPLQTASRVSDEVAAIRQWCEIAAKDGLAIAGFYH